MKTMLKMFLVAAGLGLGAGTAHAQAAPAAPPTGMGVGLSSESAVTRPGGDNSDRDATMRRDEALDKARNRDEGGKRTARTVAATPQDVVAGAEVRDSKGVRVGVIESVNLSAAVLKADGGSVEVPLDAFGKDSKGLLIGMPKADFDRLVAQATQH